MRADQRVMLLAKSEPGQRPLVILTRQGYKGLKKLAKSSYEVIGVLQRSQTY